MNYQYLLPALCATSFWISSITQGRAQVTDGPQVQVELKLVDDAGQPIEEVNALISYIGVVPNTGESFRLTSGADGTVTAKSALNGLVKATVTKEDYYPIVWPQVITKGTWEGQALIQEKIILRKIKNPVALYAKRVELSIPAFDQWIGFDFQKGDWVKPWGEGSFSDIEFHAEREYHGFRMAEEKLRIPYTEGLSEDELRYTFGKWSGTLKLRVPTGGGGIYTEKERYQAFGSTVDYTRLESLEMRLPHLSPEDGYQEKPLVWEAEHTDSLPPEIDPKLGYFLRTRVECDSDGKVTTANYAKIMTNDAGVYGSDLHFDPRGKIRFTYYFNPTANDQNLEFDPKKNLFTKLTRKEKVQFP